MTNSTTIRSEMIASNANRWRLFLVISGIIHIAVLVGCPSIYVPPKPTQQLPKIVEAEVILVIPFIWSVYLLFRYRTLEERVVGYLSLTTSLFWLAIGASILGMMY
jgi:hypothetical protein